MYEVLFNVLDKVGYVYVCEYWFDVSNCVDFWFDGLVIEVKVVGLFVDVLW